MLIETPQVEFNIETKDDNTNAFIVFQPTLGDTEINGSVLKVNNITKINNTQINPDGFKQVSTYTNPDPVGQVVNTIELGTDGTFLNLPALQIKSVVNGNTLFTTNTIDGLRLYKNANVRAGLTEENLEYSDHINLTSNYGLSSTRIKNADNQFNVNSVLLSLKDTLPTTNLSSSLSKTALTIENATAQIKSTLTTGNLEFKNDLFDLTSSLSNSTLFVSDTSGANTKSLTAVAESVEIADLTTTDLSTLSSISLNISNTTAQTNTNLSSTTLLINNPIGLDKCEVKLDTIAFLNPTTNINSSLSNSSMVIDDTVNNRDVSITSTQILYTDTASINTSTLSAYSLVLDSGTGISNIIYSSTGINGTDINIISDINSSIYLNVGLNGYLYGVNLPISNVGLPSNAIYKKTVDSETFLMIMP